MEGKGAQTVAEPGHLALRDHVQIPLPDNPSNPNQPIRPELAGPDNNIHNQRNPHPKVQQIPDKIQKGVPREPERIPNLPKIV